MWFADIVGYTRLTAQDEAAALRLVDLFKEIVREETEQRGGTVVSGPGAPGTSLGRETGEPATH